MKFLYAVIIAMLIISLLKFIFNKASYKATIVATGIYFIIVLISGMRYSLGDDASFILGIVFAGLLIVTYDKYSNEKKLLAVDRSNE